MDSTRLAISLFPVFMLSEANLVVASYFLYRLWSDLLLSAREGKGVFHRMQNYSFNDHHLSS